jgi:hypothetical protein
MQNINSDGRRRNARASTPSPDHAFDILQRLASGETLEFQARSFSIGGVSAHTRAARDLIKNGFVEDPPDLFSPYGGRITEAGMAEYHKQEKNHG